jgi:rhodanese-related sulfurtransferase
MSVKQITAEAAHQAMNGGSEVVYIDVRTPGEFDKGHPPGAINIPVVFPDPATRQMTPNPEFMGVVGRHVDKSATVIVGCQMGGRSQFAAEQMVGAGYSDVSNMQGGFGGARNPMGGIAVPGWLQLEFPVETGAPAGVSYEELKKL